MSTGRDLRALPKAHLHLHFTGSMRPATVMELSRAHHVSVPAALTAAMTDRTVRTVMPAGQRGWFRFQRLYDAARQCVRTEADMRRIVREAAEDDCAEGSRRLEIQVDPTTYARFLGGITPALEIILDEAKQASAQVGIEVAVIVAASRLRHPLEARTLARLAARYAGEGAGDVIGFGLSNDEKRGVTSDFAPAFAIARRAGLASMPHGGELLGPDHVEDVVANLHADRIGHGVRVSENSDSLRRIVDQGVAFEVCPLSNVMLGVYQSPSDVPLPALLEAGARISLNADDPVIFGSRLLDQYDMARSIHGLSDESLAKIAADSVTASQACAETKKRLLGDIEDWLKTA